MKETLAVVAWKSNSGSNVLAVLGLVSVLVGCDSATMRTDTHDPCCASTRHAAFVSPILLDRFDAHGARAGFALAIPITSSMAVTPYHAIIGVSNASLIVADGQVIPVSSIICYDEALDIAVLGIPFSGLQSSTVVARESVPRVDEQLFLMRYPKDDVVSKIPVVASSVYCDIVRGNCIDINVVTYPGDSGAAIVNQSGLLVAMVTNSVRSSDKSYTTATCLQNVRKLIGTGCQTPIPWNTWISQENPAHGDASREYLRVLPLLSSPLREVRISGLEHCVSMCESFYPAVYPLFREYYNDSQLEKAKQLVYRSNLLLHRPDVAEYCLGVVEMATGHLSEAETHLRRSIFLRDSRSAREAIARLLMASGNISDGLRQFEYASAMDPDVELSKEWYVEAWKNQQYESAHRAACRILELNDNVTSQVLLVQSLARSGNADAALQLAKQIEESHAESSLALVTLAWSYEQADRHVEADKVIDESVARFPTCVAALTMKGMSEYRNRRFGAAVVFLDRAVSNDPESVDALLWLGLACAECGQEERAKGIEEALRKIDEHAADGLREKICELSHYRNE